MLAGKQALHVFFHAEDIGVSSAWFFDLRSTFLFHQI